MISYVDLSTILRWRRPREKKSEDCARQPSSTAKLGNGAKFHGKTAWEATRGFQITTRRDDIDNAKSCLGYTTDGSAGKMFAIHLRNADKEDFEHGNSRE
jgi:hypothetical protein